MIIFLNGPSSSGKTSIAKCVQKKYATPLIHIGVFSFMDLIHSNFKGMKNKKTALGFYFSLKTVNDKKVLKFSQGMYGKKILKSAFVCMRLLAQKNDMIIEEVVSNSKELFSYLEILKGQKVYFIGVKCPLGIIEKREKERQDRIPNQSKAVYSKVHPKNRKYDLEVNTSKSSPEQCAITILNFVSRNSEPNAWNLLYNKINKEI